MSTRVIYIFVYAKQQNYPQQPFYYVYDERSFVDIHFILLSFVRIFALWSILLFCINRILLTFALSLLLLLLLLLFYYVLFLCLKRIGIQEYSLETTVCFLLSSCGENFFPFRIEEFRVWGITNIVSLEIKLDLSNECILFPLFYTCSNLPILRRTDVQGRLFLLTRLS